METVVLSVRTAAGAAPGIYSVIPTMQEVIRMVNYYFVRILLSPRRILKFLPWGRPWNQMFTTNWTSGTFETVVCIFHIKRSVSKKEIGFRYLYLFVHKRGMLPVFMRSSGWGWRGVGLTSTSGFSVHHWMQNASLSVSLSNDNLFFVYWLFSTLYMYLIIYCNS